MSKIFDALEHAQRQTIVGERPAEPRPSLSVSLPVNGRPGKTELEMEEEMISLYQTITSLLPRVDCPSVLFIGSQSNEGTSTVARQLAKAVSLRMAKSVLLIDLDRSRPDLHVYGGLRPEASAEEAGKNDQSSESAMYQVEESSLFVMPLFQRTVVTPRTLDSIKGGGFWEPLKERFDLVIVDSPPATRFPDGLGVVSQVDGVIMVVEAEGTRWQVALSVKDKILKSGGNILGIVFNKRKYYIPEFIYRHL
jgi:protein-tyrosine kinase